MTDTLTETYAKAALNVLDQTIVTLNKRRHEFTAILLLEAMGAANVDRFEFGVTASNASEFRIIGDFEDVILRALTGLSYADFEDLEGKVTTYDDYDDDEDANLYVVHYDNVYQFVLGAYPKYPKIGA